ncbi:protein swallow [Episyrphus balteatus]|uniref:protein swallow n=1 Tax=Episyrphus balteatus TaxID=286459 RepID=UPI002486537C|nr:protein swallow [Episyrphus balteatus]
MLIKLKLKLNIKFISLLTLHFALLSRVNKRNIFNPQKNTMSISDESFPDDDLYTTKINNNCKCNVSSSLSSSPLNDRNLSASTSGQSSSGHSRETTQSVPVKVPERHDEEDYPHKVRSYQDLHSAYTKRRYPHVKSKVREFIESQKAEEELRKSTRDYLRRFSTPNAKDDTNNKLDFDGTENHPETEEDPSDIAKFMVEKEQEVVCLKALNEYLQESLQEKMIEATRLRRNVDCLRVELLNAKDKAKRHSMHSVGMEYRANQSRPRLSLPTLVYKQQRTTTATQTDFELYEAPPTTDDNNNNSIGLYDQKIVATVQPLPLNYSNDHLGHIQRQIRRRNNSNPPTPTAEHQSTPNRVDSAPSDSAIDTEEGDDSSSENALREEFMLFEKINPNDTTNFANQSNTQMKKKRSFKRKFKWIFGPCGKCSDQRNNSSIGEQYSQTPLLDSLTSDHKLRFTDNSITS